MLAPRHFWLVGGGKRQTEDARVEQVLGRDWGAVGDLVGRTEQGSRKTLANHSPPCEQLAADVPILLGRPKGDVQELLGLRFHWHVVMDSVYGPNVSLTLKCGKSAT
jgi:hypothetical protein